MLWNGRSSSFKESFTPQAETKETDAISDTGDVIRANLQDNKYYTTKMNTINNNYQTLSNDIHVYDDLKEVMKSNPRYDYKGTELLYFRNKVKPDVRQKSVLDNNELNVTNELLFTLGTLTTATLIVFAVILARE